MEKQENQARDQKKLVLSKVSIKSLTARTGVRTGKQGTVVTEACHTDWCSETP